MSSYSNKNCLLIQMQTLIVSTYEENIYIFTKYRPMQTENKGCKSKSSFIIFGILKLFKF